MPAGEDLVGLGRGGPVGRLHHQLAVQPLGVLGGDLALQRRRHEYVALRLEHVHPAHVLRAGEPAQEVVLGHPGEHGAEVEPVRVDQPAGHVGHADDGGPSGRQLARDHRADVAEALDRHPMPSSFSFLPRRISSSTNTTPRPVAMSRPSVHPDATVRAACLDALGRIGPTRAGSDVTARVRELTRDRDQTVRAHAVVALAAIQGGQVAAAADDPSPEVMCRRCSMRARRSSARSPAIQIRTCARPRSPSSACGSPYSRAVRRTGSRYARRGDRRDRRQAPRADRPRGHRQGLAGAARRGRECDRRAHARSARRRRRARGRKRRPGRARSAPRANRFDHASLLRLAAGPSDRERVRLALAWLLATRP